MKITESQIRKLIRRRLIKEREERVSARSERKQDRSDRRSQKKSGSFSGAEGGGGGPGDRDSSGSAVVIKMPGDDGFNDPNLIYVYPGIGEGGYGQQGWVADAIDGSNVGSEPNTVVAIADKKDTSWPSFKQQGIDAYKEATGTDEEPGSARMVGWSAGADGLSQSTNDSFLDMIWYADPSPIGKLIKSSHGNVKMYYNPENWNIDGFNTDRGFRKLSQKVNNSTQVDEDHNDIFYRSMREALSQ